MEIYNVNNIVAYEVPPTVADRLQLRDLLLASGYRICWIRCDNLTFDSCESGQYEFAVGYWEHNFNIQPPPLRPFVKVVYDAIAALPDAAPYFEPTAKELEVMAELPNGFRTDWLRRCHPEPLPMVGMPYELHRLAWNVPAPPLDDSAAWIHPGLERPLSVLEIDAIRFTTVYDWLAAQCDRCAAGLWNDADYESTYSPDAGWTGQHCAGAAEKCFNLLRYIPAQCQKPRAPHRHFNQDAAGNLRWDWDTMIEMRKGFSYDPIQ